MRFAVVMDGKNIKKTHLHLASKLRWDSFQKYLDWLQSKGYITRSNIDGSDTYIATQQGREMFDRLSKFLECIKSEKYSTLNSRLD